MARQQQLYRQLIDAGKTPTEVLGLTLADLPDTPEARRYMDRRARVGVDTSGNAPYLVELDGKPVTAENLDRHLIFARTVSVSIEGNASFCRSLLAVRYGLTETNEVKEACS
jgi:hypothetical protein